MLTHLRIHWKLALLSLTFLAPVTLLAYLFIKQSYQDISAAKKEITAVYSIDVLRDIELLVASDNLSAAVAQLSALDEVNARFGGQMKLSEISKNLAQALRHADTENGNSLEVLAVILELTGQIGDESNLLNSDRNIFYSMDIAVVRLPRITRQTIAVFEAARHLVAHEKPVLAELVDFHVKLAEFNGTLNNVDLSLTSAYRGDANDILMRKLDLAFEQFRTTAKAYVAALDEIGKDAATGNPAARQALGDLARLKMAFLEQDKKVWELSCRELERLLINRIHSLNTKLNWNLGGSGMVLLIAVLLAILISRSISKPITELVAAMKHMAQGDMTVQVRGAMRGDEVGILARAALDMQRQLHGLAGEVRSLAGQVYKAVQDIANSVAGQAAGSSQMSASVAEITSTVEELSASSTQIAENSHAVVEIAKLTYENSIKGQQAMTEVADKTTEIQNDNQNSLHEILELARCSKEITKVMEIINTVADQTKLIAFNAALEAAGAGDAGRRFGVVASEIRRLADSVTESTGEIERRINQIQEAINRLAVTSEKGVGTILAGMESASHTRDSLAELVEAARQSSSAAQQISLSTQQQKTASSQVVIALREIVSASSHTAESITCISEISKELARLSNELEQVLTRFKLRQAD